MYATGWNDAEHAIATGFSDSEEGTVTQYRQRETADEYAARVLAQAQELAAEPSRKADAYLRGCIGLLKFYQATGRTVRRG